MATTHSAEPVASNGLPTEPSTTPHIDATVSARVLAWFSALYCGLHGHDNLMQFGKDRVYLRCVSCGHESPGWALKAAPPRIVARGDARRHPSIRRRLMRERRIA
jgi:hypothetical protein